MTPRFLGVHLDRELTFNAHTDEITTKSKSKMGMLSTLSHTAWGCLKKDLMKVYISHMRSTMDYAAPGCQYGLADTNLNELEVEAKSKALRKCRNLSCLPKGKKPTHHHTLP